MMTIDRALEIAWGVAWKGGTIVVALSLLTVTVEEFRNGSAAASPQAPVRSEEQERDAEEKRVKLESIPFGISQCILQSEEGDELLKVEYSHDASVGLRFGRAFPVQFGCVATPDGACVVNVNHREGTYSLRIRPDGVSGFTVTRRSLNETSGVGLTDGDEFVYDPRLIR